MRCINLCVHLRLERAICIPQSGLASMGWRNRPSARGLPCQSVGCPYIAEESRSYCCNRCKEGNNKHSRNCTAIRTASKPTPKSMPKTKKRALEQKAEYLKQRLQASALSARARAKNQLPFCPFREDAGHECEPACLNWTTSHVTGMPEQNDIWVDASSDDAGSDMD